jgi:hypothetical protein
VEHFQASDNLVENIFQKIATPMLSDGGNGTVFAYNFDQRFLRCRRLGAGQRLSTWPRQQLLPVGRQ